MDALEQGRTEGKGVRLVDAAASECRRGLLQRGQIRLVQAVPDGPGGGVIELERERVPEQRRELALGCDHARIVEVDRRGRGSAPAVDEDRDIERIVLDQLR